MRHTVGGAQNVVTRAWSSTRSRPRASKRGWFRITMVAPAIHGAKKLLHACLAHPGDEMFRCTSPGCNPIQYIVDKWPTG